jgi:hypothetical protein
VPWDSTIHRAIASPRPVPDERLAGANAAVQPPNTVLLLIDAGVRLARRRGRRRRQDGETLPRSACTARHCREDVHGSRSLSQSPSTTPAPPSLSGRGSLRLSSDGLDGDHIGLDGANSAAPRLRSGSEEVGDRSAHSLRFIAGVGQDRSRVLRSNDPARSRLARIAYAADATRRRGSGGGGSPSAASISLNATASCRPRRQVGPPPPARRSPLTAIARRVGHVRDGGESAREDEPAREAGRRRTPPSRSDA